MRSILLFILFILSSCGKNAFLKVEKKVLGSAVVAVPVADSRLCAKTQSLIVAAIEGEWDSGCISHIPGYSLVTNVKVDSQGNYTLDYELFKGSSCTSSEAKIVYNYDFVSQGCLDETSDVVKVNFITTNVLFTAKSDNYRNYLQRISECGITTWTKNQEYNIEGLRCPFLISTDPHHDTYRSFGDVLYSILSIETGSLLFGDWMDSSGDTESERLINLKSSPEYTLRKLD